MDSEKLWWDEFSTIVDANKKCSENERMMVNLLGVGSVVFVLVLFSASNFFTIRK